MLFTRAIATSACLWMCKTKLLNLKLHASGCVKMISGCKKKKKLKCYLVAELFCCLPALIELTNTSS